MFTIPKDYRSDRRHSREFDRLMARKEKQRFIFHGLIHKRCHLCSGGKWSGYCHNCCTPMCQGFVNNKIAWKKHTKNSNKWHCQHSKPIRIHSASDLQSIVNDNVKNGQMNKIAIVRQSPSTMNCVDALDNMASNSIAPSAPTIGHELFNNENEADVTLLVGFDKNKQWRFPGHSIVLNNASSYFRNLISDTNNNNNKEISINFCEPETFRIILKYVYTQELTLKSVQETLILFTVSIRLSMITLAKHCLEFLNKNCDLDNVLLQLTFFHNYFKQLMYEKQDFDSFHGVSDVFDELFKHWFDIIDQNASSIIASDSFLKLNSDLVGTVVERDTLNVNSELDVYNGICKWADQQCIQQRKEITDQNKRDLLQNLIFSPRYLTMNLDEFLNGPFKEEILTKEEKDILRKGFDSDNAEMPLNFEKAHKRRQYEPPVCDEGIDEYYEICKLSKSLSYEKGLSEKKKRTVPQKIVKGFKNSLFFIIKVLD